MFLDQIQILRLADAVALYAESALTPRQIIDREIVASIITVDDVRTQRQELKCGLWARRFQRFRRHLHRARLEPRRDRIIADQDLKSIAIGRAASQGRESKRIGSLN